MFFNNMWSSYSPLAPSLYGSDRYLYNNAFCRPEARQVCFLVIIFFFFLFSFDMASIIIYRIPIPQLSYRSLII